MFVLGIESSCDETAAAVVDENGVLRSNVVFTQLAEHLPFGGVVPEIAARAHLQRIDDIIKAALDKAGIGFSDLSAVAAAGGPGLIGGVIVGVMTAKAIAACWKIPFIGVNHLEGHALAAFIDNKELTFPYLLLLTSGGHCQILEVNGTGSYKLLGKTIDDAAGEAFDKTAKLLGIGYPGGPMVEKMAQSGDAKRFKLPRPLKNKHNCDFSFSGLKSAVRRKAEELGGNITIQDKCDLCAAFQAAVIDIMHSKTLRAIEIFKTDKPDGRFLVTAGGVAANTALRNMLKTLAEENGLNFAVPPASLCTDNGAMIAYAGLKRLQAGLTDSYAFRPRPKWTLYE